MTRRDVVRYALYFLAVSIVCIPHYLWQFTLHDYAHVPVSPISNTIELISDGFRSSLTYISTNRQLVEKLRDAKQKNLALKRENRSLKLLEHRYRQLRQNAGLPVNDTMPFTTRSAEVVHSNLTEWERTVEINRGYNDGVRVGMPVLNYVGDTWVLYGEVRVAHSSKSKVITTADPRFKIGVVIDGVEDRQFVARGSGDAGLKLNHFPRVIDVPLNANVRTAPASSVAPPGLLLGRISQVSERTIRPETGHQVWIQPAREHSVPTVLWVLPGND